MLGLFQRTLSLIGVLLAVVQTNAVDTTKTHYTDTVVVENPPRITLTHSTSEAEDAPFSCTYFPLIGKKGLEYDFDYDLFKGSYQDAIVKTYTKSMPRLPLRLAELTSFLPTEDKSITLSFREPLPLNPIQRHKVLALCPGIPVENDGNDSYLSYLATAKGFTLERVTQMTRMQNTPGKKDGLDKKHPCHYMPDFYIHGLPPLPIRSLTTFNAVQNYIKDKKVGDFALYAVRCARNEKDYQEGSLSLIFTYRPFPNPALQKMMAQSKQASPEVLPLVILAKAKQKRHCTIYSWNLLFVTRETASIVYAMPFTSQNSVFAL